MQKVAIAAVVVIVVAGVIAWVLVVGIISPFNPVPGDYRDLSISMAVTGGWCVCVEQWEIDGNGNVSYELSGPTVAHWWSSAKITPQQVEELIAAIQKANVWALQDRYGHGFFDPICQDCSTVDLYIRLNGRSKHISYYEALCGYKWGAPPPQALCDLQHEVEAIGRLAFPTPTPWPTATPVPPPMPTIPPPPFMATGDFGIISQEPCGPPCFLGIRPDVTTFDEAALILQNAGAPCGAAGKFLSCQSGSTSISVWGPAVDGINLAPPAMITLAEFIAKYGPPDTLVFQVSAPPTFYYTSLQTVAILPMQSVDSYTLTPGTTITGAFYLAPAEYKKWLYVAKNYQQPWKGYGTYTPKMNP